MRTAIFLVVLSLAYMFYRGDFGRFEGVSQFQQRQVDVSVAAIHQDKARPKVGLEIFEKEKSSLVAQQLWLESHRIEEERTVLDKLRNLASFGKYE